MTDWIAFGQIISIIGCIATLLAESILIVLTLFFVKRDFGIFKFLLVSFSVVGAIFAVTEAVVSPMLHSYKAGYMFLTLSKPFGASKNVMTTLLAFYSGFYAATISVLAIQFLYRYWAVFNQNRLSLFKGWKCMIWFFYASFFGFACAIGFYVLAYPDYYSEDYLRSPMFDYYNKNISEVPTLSIVVYNFNTDGTKNFRPRNVAFIIYMSNIMLTQYLVMIYCGRKMYYELGANISQQSQATITLHKQIFRVLVLQITLPTFFLFAPVTMVMYLPFLNLEISLPTGIWMCGFNFYPAVDAMIVMFVITDYRMVFKKATNDVVHRISTFVETTSNVGRVHVVTL